MTALITGASSGIGRDMAIYLSSLGYSLVLTGRSKEKLMELKNSLKTPVKIITADLSKPENAVRLYKCCKNIKIDFLVNNAGIGVVGDFDKTSLKTEVELININVTSLHILTKLFLKDFVKRDSGRILNVASSAAFFPGPLMAAYYASKNYVLNLSESLYRELKEKGSNVKISVLCPGPVQTEFNIRAGVTNSFKPSDSTMVARYAIDEALKDRFYIVPTLHMKLGVIGASAAPNMLLSKIVYRIQRGKKPL